MRFVVYAPVAKQAAIWIGWQTQDKKVWSSIPNCSQPVGGKDIPKHASFFSSVIRSLLKPEQAPHGELACVHPPAT